MNTHKLIKYALIFIPEFREQFEEMKGWTGVSLPDHQ